MNGVRFTFRYLGFGANGFIPVMPGEPVFDPNSKRFGIGIGGYAAVWYPKATTEGNLQFDTDQGLVSSDGVYSIKFTASGIKWNVNGDDVLSTRGADGIAVRTGIIMRNGAGADVVTIGYGHYVAIMALLMNLKALLRKFVANTATTGDVDALLTLGNSINPATLDPAFPESTLL